MMISATLLLSVLLLPPMQQPSLPAAPQPRTTPTPGFKFPPPEKYTPVSPSPQPKQEQIDEFGVPRRILDGPNGFVIKDFLVHQVQPTVFRCWNDVMPEEAKDHRRLGIVKKGKSAVVRVSFTLHKDGAITGIVLDETSGDKVLDTAALKAIKDSQPLRLPAAFPDNSLTLHTSFYYNPKHKPE
jgi:TonB family protein